MTLTLTSSTLVLLAICIVGGLWAAGHVGIELGQFNRSAVGFWKVARLALIPCLAGAMLSAIVFVLVFALFT